MAVASLEPRKINPLAIILYLPSIAHVIAWALTGRRSFTSPAPDFHLCHSTSPCPVNRLHHPKSTWSETDVEKGLVFLCFHTHVLPEAASSPGHYTNSYKTYLEHYRGSSLGEGTGQGLRTFLLLQYRK